VILTIAIVIGANTGLFPYLETMILRNVESEAKQLVVIAERKSDGPASLSFSYPMYVGLRRNNETPRRLMDAAVRRGIWIMCWVASAFAENLFPGTTLPCLARIHGSDD
jgi:hypothetical protein